MGRSTKYNYNNYTKEFLEPIVKDSYSMWEVMRKVHGSTYSGSRGMRTHMQHILFTLEIDTAHFLPRGKRDRYQARRELTDDFLFQLHTRESMKAPGRYNQKAKERLVALGKPYICDHCGVSEWNNKPLKLQLEHKDGCNLNYNKENLAFLCPNCHSQTPTWGGGNQKRKEINEST